MAQPTIAASTRKRSGDKARSAPNASGIGKARPKVGEALKKALEAGPGRSSVHHKAKTVIFRQGDPADAVFHVERGRVQLTVVSDHGKEGVVAILGPGDFFSEGCLAGQVHHMATARTMEPSTIIRIEKSTMVRMLRDEPDRGGSVCLDRIPGFLSGASAGWYRRDALAA